MKKAGVMNVRNSLFTKTIIFLTASLFLLGTSRAQADTDSTNSFSSSVLTPNSSDNKIWQGAVGDGFVPGARSITAAVGAGYGIRMWGSKKNHDLCFGSVQYGYVLTPVWGDNHWYKGNLELRGEFFAGGQYLPTSDWVVGLTPHLRYNFATGTRWQPYVDAGAGVSATSIGPPDLNHYFEFNIQANLGIRYFLRDNFAVGFEARYMHLSCAGINSPNQGLNSINGLFSASWYF